jgi:hypothetical protein
MPRRSTTPEPVTVSLVSFVVDKAAVRLEDALMVMDVELAGPVITPAVAVTLKAFAAPVELITVDVTPEPVRNTFVPPFDFTPFCRLNVATVAPAE